MATLPRRGRKKIELKRIENEKERIVSLSKRHNGVFKKACELATLCGIHIAIIVFTIGGKSLSFGSPSISSVINNFMKENEVDEHRENFMTQLANSNEAGLEELNQHYNEISEKLENERKREKFLKEKLKGSFGECISGLGREKLVQLKLQSIKLEKILKDNRESRIVCSSSNDDYNADLYKMELPRDYLKL